MKRSRHSISDARSQLPRLVRAAEAGETIELTRRGELVAVLIGHDEHLRLRSRGRGFAEAYEEFRHHTDLEALAIDPDEVFERTRDEGRDVRL